jgi:hypothetical protein
MQRHSAYKTQKLILAFAAERPKLADFKGAFEDINDSWWLGKVADVCEACRGGADATGTHTCD